MIRALSYVIAVIITFTIAVFLYPIAGLFWILGLFGKISQMLFSFTSKTIKKLWRELKDDNRGDNVQIIEKQLLVKEADFAENNKIWECLCGAKNEGNFCLKCGAPKPFENNTNSNV